MKVFILLKKYYKELIILIPISIYVMFNLKKIIKQ